MIHLDPKRLPGPLRQLFFVHLQVVGRPVFRVAVLGSRPKHPHHPIPFPMHDAPCPRDHQRLNRHVARVVGVDQPIALEAGQPMPAVAPDRLQVRQGGVPAIEQHHLGPKAAAVG